MLSCMDQGAAIPAGRLEAIWIKRFRRGPMDARGEATLVAGAGLEHNTDQGGKRQVTLISRERGQRVEAELDVRVNPAARRANLMISGLSLTATRGQRLIVGPCVLLIGGETRPCERMEEACPGLQAALLPDWGGGVFAQVLEGGQIRLGDAVRWDSGEYEARQ